MDKEQIKQELKIAYKEREYKQEMLNFVDRDFVDVVIYEIKAIDCKIEALKNMLEDKNEIQQIKTADFWNKHIESFMNMAVNIKNVKKESPATKLNDSL